MTAFKIGDRVAFAREFLRNTGQITGWKPFAEGVVVGVLDFGSGGRSMVTVAWDRGRTEKLAGESSPGKSNALDTALIHANRKHLEAI